MGSIYTPQLNTVANILNRRTDTDVIDTLKFKNTFADLIKSPIEFGDTIEHIQKALSEKKNYNPTQTISGKYVKQYLNKIYICLKLHTLLKWSFGHTLWDTPDKSGILNAFSLTLTCRFTEVIKVLSDVTKHLAMNTSTSS